MYTLKEVIQAARRLAEGEQKQLVAALPGSGRERLSEEQRREAMVSWLALGGSFHSEFRDVSTDKYKHLGDVYADRP